ncbi:hypothetical protein MXB_333 [Myxobolus squamalis]|nr:hypothetical protein MXB_333 [Myxobolus squamalis]
MVIKFRNFNERDCRTIALNCLGLTAPALSTDFAWLQTDPLKLCPLLSSNKSNKSLFSVYQRWINYLHPSINMSHWKSNENSQLVKMAKIYGMRNWHLISQKLNLNKSNRLPWQCLTQFQQCFNKEMWSSTWTSDEDDILIILVRKYGVSDWATISLNFNCKTREQCRLRFLFLTRDTCDQPMHELIDNVVSGDMTEHGFIRSIILNHSHSPKKGIKTHSKAIPRWSRQEDDILVQGYEMLKNTRGIWSKISKSIPGRSKYSFTGFFDDCQNMKRLLTDVWSRRSFISNYQYGNRKRPVVESLVESNSGSLPFPKFLKAIK